MPFSDKKQSFQYPQKIKIVAGTMIFHYRGINKQKNRDRLSEYKINRAFLSNMRCSLAKQGIAQTGNWELGIGNCPNRALGIPHFFENRYNSIISKKYSGKYSNPKSVKICSGSVPVPTPASWGQPRGVCRYKNYTNYLGLLYLASILTEIPAENQTTKEGRIAGINLGLKYLAIVEDDEKVSKYDFNAKHLTKHEKNRKRKHQKLTVQHKKRNYEYKYRKAVTEVCERLRNSGKNFLHKLSYKWVSDRLPVIVENFYFRDVILDAKFAKALSDEVWGSYINFLAAYKLERKGGNLVEMDRWYFSSQLCSNCFHQMREMPLDMREGTCPHCASDRGGEENAAIKMKAEGIKIQKAEGSAVSALGGEVRLKLGQKSQLRHSPMSTEAPTIFGTRI
ncbi:transposase [Microcoleus sp. F6_B4]